MIIASDTYRPRKVLPINVIHRTDIVGDMQFPYIVNCNLMIIPVDDGEICSGDTVLLKAMSYKKPVIVTMPSTLGEMYIDNNVNGILMEKDEKNFGQTIDELLNDKDKMRLLGNNARKTYSKKYSRLQMGYILGKEIRNYSD